MTIPISVNPRADRIVAVDVRHSSATSAVLSGNNVAVPSFQVKRQRRETTESDEDSAAQTTSMARTSSFMVQGIASAASGTLLLSWDAADAATTVVSAFVALVLSDSKGSLPRMMTTGIVICTRWKFWS